MRVEWQWGGHGQGMGEGGQEAGRSGFVGPAKEVKDKENTVSGGGCVRSQSGKK